MAIFVSPGAAIAGGTCALTPSPLTAVYIPSDTGTWTSSLTGPNTGLGTLAVTVSSANADGQFPATATLSYSGLTCSVSLNFTGLVSGYSLQLSDTRPNPDTVTLNTSATPAVLSVNLATGTTCPAGVYTGAATHQ